jgi:hypothetical protein
LSQTKQKNKEDEQNKQATRRDREQNRLCEV